MKKLLAAVLALTVILSMGVTAFADAKDDLANFVDDNVDINDSRGTSAYWAIVGNIDDTTNPVLNNKNDTVKPSKTVYFWIDEDLADNDDLSIKFKKGDGAKMIESIKLVEKILDDNWYLWNDEDYSEDERQWYIEVKLRDSMIDEETKISFTMTVKAKKDIQLPAFSGPYPPGATPPLITIPAGTSYEYEAQPFWLNNKVDNADANYAAGTGGVVVKPTKNDDNEVVWEDENNTLATLTFTGDSDVTKFYPKMSTKWSNEEYAKNFADTDAFIRLFVGTPAISSTSRPVLELNNPFVNEDGEETVAVEDIVIYELKNGELIDVTGNFKADINDDDESVFTIKTRTLGTYIFADGGAATEAEDAPAVEEGKVVPNTGR